MSARPSPVALVTGSASGMGAAIVQRLSADGQRVVVADRDEAAATLGHLRAQGDGGAIVVTASTAGVSGSELGAYSASKHGVVALALSGDGGRGGGHGWLSRRVGWASDTLRSAELVTADGRYVRCSAEEEPELFWSIRGAGHNFGTVVGLELDLIDLDSVAFGMVWFDPDATAEGLVWCRDHLPNAPDELTTIVSVGHPPASLGLPDRLRSRAALHVLACHSGPPEQARRDLADLRAHPDVTASTIKDASWTHLAMGNAVFISAFTAARACTTSTT